MKSSIVTTVEKIGPKTAKKYLESAARNRALNKRIVDKYASVMTDGAWETTHQGIAFDAEGKIFDGQHRLSAIVQSGKTIEMQVSRYEIDAPMSVVDSGHVRTPGDRMVISGVVDAHGREIFSILNALACIDSGTYSGSKLQSYQASTIYEAEQKNIEFATSTFGYATTRQWSTSLRACFAYCYAFAPKECTELAILLKDKSGLKKGSAAQAFVNAIADGKLILTGGHNRTDSLAKILWLIRQHIEGKPVERVKATAAIFNWAKRQRQFSNVQTIAEVLA